jgi:signal peptidase I
MSRRSIRPGAAILGAVALAAAVKLFVLDAVVVDGRSMLPLLKSGSIVLVLRCAYGIRNPLGPGYAALWASPRRGEVVAAASPRDGRVVVKRVAAVGPAELAVAAGRLVGPAVDAPLDAARAAELGDAAPVPEGTVFLLGDNAPESVDSREYGPVPVAALYGRALVGARRSAP